MLLADRGFANHELMVWLRNSQWHYAIRLPRDVLLHGTKPLSQDSWFVVPTVGRGQSVSSGRFVGGWNALLQSCGGNGQSAMATVSSLMRRRVYKTFAICEVVEELFLNSKSGAFELKMYTCAQLMP